MYAGSLPLATLQLRFVPAKVQPCIQSFVVKIRKEREQKIGNIKQKNKLKLKNCERKKYRKQKLKTVERKVKSKKL